MNEGEKADPQPRGVKARGITLDDADFLKPYAAAGTLRGGKADFLGELGIGEAPIGLECRKQFEVELIERASLSQICHFSHNPCIASGKFVHYTRFSRGFRAIYSFLKEGQRKKMGPFPHDAPPAKISAENPAGTDGFEFVEFAHPEPGALRTLFEQMGFALVARHKSRAIDLYRQGGVNYILNGDRASFGGRFVDLHGPCAPAMAWRVVDAKHAFAYALERGARPYKGETGAKTIDAPAILGIGGSLIYFIDTFGAKGSPYEAEFDWVGERDPVPAGCGIDYIDHLTNNVFRGAMDRWYQFYQNLFNFRQIRYFDIAGKSDWSLFPRVDQSVRKDPDSLE